MPIGAGIFPFQKAMAAMEEKFCLVMKSFAW